MYISSRKTFRLSWPHLHYHGCCGLPSSSNSWRQLLVFRRASICFIYLEILVDTIFGDRLCSARWLWLLHYGLTQNVKYWRQIFHVHFSSILYECLLFLHISLGLIPKAWAKGHKRYGRKLLDILPYCITNSR